MKYKDVTSYSSSDKERKPRVLECSLTATIKFTVHKHIYFGEEWLVSCRYAGLDKQGLGTTDIEIAKEKAKEVMLKALETKKSEAEKALAKLSQ